MESRAWSTVRWTYWAKRISPWSSESPRGRAKCSLELKRPIIDYVKDCDSPTFRTTKLGPVMLMDNFITGSKVFLPSVLSAWKPGKKRSFVYTYDVGKIAAICLTEPDTYGGKDICLIGDSVTPEEIAAMFKEIKGITLPRGEVPPMPEYLTVNFKAS